MNFDIYITLETSKLYYVRYISIATYNNFNNEVSLKKACLCSAEIVT